MSQSALLVGRTTSDIIYNVLSLVIMSLTGLIVGWRIRGSLVDALLAYMLRFAYAFSWVMAWVGLIVPSVEVVNNASFIVIFPVTFIANTFVETSRLSSLLRPFAEWNAVSAVAQATRELFGNAPAAAETVTWALRTPVTYALVWIVIIVAVFAPLSIRQYQRATAR